MPSKKSDDSKGVGGKVHLTTVPVSPSPKPVSGCGGNEHIPRNSGIVQSRFQHHELRTGRPSFGRVRDLPETGATDTTACSGSVGWYHL